MKTKQEYIAPQLTVVTFKQELGYAASINTLQTFSLFQILEPGYNTQGQQLWEENTTFGDEW